MYSINSLEHQKGITYIDDVELTPLWLKTDFDWFNVLFTSIVYFRHSLVVWHLFPKNSSPQSHWKSVSSALLEQGRLLRQGSLAQKSGKICQNLYGLVIINVFYKCTATLRDIII